MTTRSKKVVPVVKTTQESAVVESPVSEEVMTIDFTMIKDTIDNWNTSEIEDLIAYAQSIITNRKREEEAELEQQLLEIQSKLNALRGPVVVSVSNGEKAVKNKRSIVNPKDHSQVYTFGKHPKWLTELVAEQAAKDLSKSTYQIMDELREASKTL